MAGWSDVPFVVAPFSWLSPLEVGVVPLRSVTGLLSTGGAMLEEGVTSIGSPGGGARELAEFEGRMGMDLCIAEAESGEKGLRDNVSVADAILRFHRSVSGQLESLQHRNRIWSPETKSGIECGMAAGSRRMCGSQVA
jgi:hypothetical protein